MARACEKSPRRNCSLARASSTSGRGAGATCGGPAPRQPEPALGAGELPGIEQALAFDQRAQADALARRVLDGRLALPPDHALERSDGASAVPRARRGHAVQIEQ